MGWFSGSKKTYVSSVLYNLSGDISKRPLYKTTVVASAVFNQNPLADAIQTAYLKGGAIRLRGYERWARTQGYRELINYEASTMPSINEIDANKVLAYVSHDPTETLEVVSHDIGSGNYEYWVEQYMFANHPNIISDKSINWTFDFNEKTNVITIKFLESATVETFSPVNFDPKAQYIYLYFRRNKTGADVSTTEGEWVTLFDWDIFPDTFGWEEKSNTTNTTPITYQVNVKSTQSFSDGRPDIVTNSSYTDSLPREDFNRVYEKTSFIGSSESDNPEVLMNQTKIMNLVQTTTTEDYKDSNVTNDVIAGGVQRTTITIEDKKRTIVGKQYKIDKKNFVALSIGMPEVFIYKQGDGIAELDAMFEPQIKIEKGYYPPIPIRIDNKFVRDEYPDIFTGTKRAFKRAFGTKIEKLYETLEKGDKDSTPEEMEKNLKEMDFIYIAFGVSLNTKDNSGRRYIYEYFRYLGEAFNGETNLPSFQAEWEAADRSNSEYRRWLIEQNRVWSGEDGITGAPEVIPYPKIPKRSIFLRAANGYNMELSWGFITEKTIFGKYKPTAKVGDVFIDPADYVNSNGQSLTEEEKKALSTGTKLNLVSYSMNTIRISYQIKKNQFIQLTVVNPYLKNTVYNGKSVNTSGYDGIVLEDETEDSPFMVPLYEPIYRTMPITHATQMVQVSGYAVINCYKIVKQKWYQTGIFQLVVIIVVAVISFYFPPASGAAGGILGTNVAVGTAIVGAGASAMLIAIVGSIVNSLAAMIVASIINQVATEVIGGKLGALISTVLSVWVSSGFSFENVGNSFSNMFTDLTSASNLLKLTTSALDVGSLLFKMQAADIMGGMDQVQANIDRANEISKLYNDEFASNSIITPEMIQANSNSFRVESLDSFMARTLMTGGDIVETTLNMVTEFPSITLQLPTNS